MNLSIFNNKIGTYDDKLNCLYTIYLMYPEIPIYKIIHDKEYFIPILEKYFKKIENLEKGNLILFQFYNGFHFGIYAENNRFFHCCQKHKLRLSNLEKYKKFVIGTYKCQKQ